jgi:CPA1 family monovalent cation:H+ antiporter
MLFARYTAREIWISTFAGVRGAITLAGVLSIPLFLSSGEPFPSRYQLVFIATGVILFSLLCGVVALPLLLRGITLTDHSVQKKEERMARVTMAQVAIDCLKKMQERLAADREENLDDQVLAEVSARVIGMLHRRVAGTDELENNMAVENLERRFRLAAVSAERAELYHLRATQRISNETLQKMLRELDLLEAVLSEKV